jgi:hypothetical protein
MRFTWSIFRWHRWHTVSGVFAVRRDFDDDRGVRSTLRPYGRGEQCRIGSGLDPSGAMLEPEEERPQVARVLFGSHGTRESEVLHNSNGSGFGILDDLGEGGDLFDPCGEGAAGNVCGMARGAAGGASGETLEEGSLGE